MNRRRFLRASALGTATGLFAGCLGGDAPSDASAEQSGSGHPCDEPRNIDYRAVDEYRDGGVYVENVGESAHTACVTVTAEDREPEEAGTSPPPLLDQGYAIQPGMAVEVFRVDEPGRYTVTVRVEEATETVTVERTTSDRAGGKTRTTTFEIVGPARIRVSR